MRQGRLEHVVQFGLGSAGHGNREAVRPAELQCAHDGFLVETPLERLEFGPHLGQQGIGGSEQLGSVIAPTFCGLDRGEALEAPGEILLVARLAAVEDAFVESLAGNVQPTHAVRDGGQIEERACHVGGVSPRTEQREALLEEWLRALSLRP